jgi:hypothetical protein
MNSVAFLCFSKKGDEADFTTITREYLNIVSGKSLTQLFLANLAEPYVRVISYSSCFHQAGPLSSVARNREMSCLQTIFETRRRPGFLPGFRFLIKRRKAISPVTLPTLSQQARLNGLFFEPCNTKAFEKFNSYSPRRSFLKAPVGEPRLAVCVFLSRNLSVMRHSRCDS